MNTRAKKSAATDAADVLHAALAPSAHEAPKPPTPVGSPLAATADEQLAGQIAMATAEDRLKAEIEAGKKAVAEAEARVRAAE